MAYRYDPYASSPGSGAGGPSSYPHQGNAPPQHDPYHSSNNGGNYGYGGYTTHAAPGGVYAQPDPSGPASMTAHTGPIRTQYHTYRHQHQPHPATMAYSSPTSPRAATAGGPSSIDSTDRGWGGATTRALSNSVSGTGAGAGGSVGYEEEGGYYEESASASWGGGSYRGDRGRGGAMGRGGRGRGTGGSMSGGYGGGAPPSRREYEDPSRLVRRTDFDSVIDERVSRERPCRTLFIRNVKFGTDVQEIRELFEPIGHIKTLFDMLDKKGMVFLTYYDLRAAMMAKDKLHETRLSGRPIDVHYGLLKDSDLNKPCDLEKNQGSLSLYVVGARGPLDDREIHARFGVFGEVKHVVSSAVGGGTRHGSSLIEFFDSRAMDRAFHEMNGQPMAGGTIELHYEWDLTTVSVPPPHIPFLKKRNTDPLSLPSITGIPVPQPKPSHLDPIHPPLVLDPIDPIEIHTHVTVDPQGIIEEVQGNSHHLQEGIQGRKGNTQREPRIRINLMVLALVVVVVLQLVRRRRLRISWKKRGRCKPCWRR
ncbi:BQ2448_6881 [Microbotryum intermedium]|uniref:BQ2448_6881 protein n=1 Tax=Microbotryum intermedium TaxID=269621 RepID=A0A238FPD2_9BASI|nr:BQ2448_6881 [Microbotryum intermedium]